MSKFVYAGLVALIITGSSFPAHAQAASVGDARKQLTASELENLTDARVAIVKFALQLTPEQEKHWAAVEDAIRARAAGRQARLANKLERAGELRDKNAIEMVRDRDPIAFLNRRADALAQRAAELKRLAAAWQPLYETLSAEQKRRLGVISVLVIREVKDETEVHLLRKDDDED
jgi:hypothetical protein